MSGEHRDSAENQRDLDQAFLSRGGAALPSWLRNSRLAALDGYRYPCRRSHWSARYPHTGDR